jgi:uncharacterized protein YdeI (YjbR/CyaY-like superfamily)
MPPANKRDTPRVECLTRAEWRAWLAANHATSSGVWLVYRKKSCGGLLSYDEQVEEALCFGWVDSVPGKLDTERTMLYHSPRKAGSGWAKTNKARVEKLLAAGLMTPAGQAKIDSAKADGSWTLLDAIEAMEMPPDLAKALKANPTAKGHFDAFPPGVRKGIFQWIVLAKRPDTRAKRVAETVTLAAQNVRANQYRKPGEA